MYEGMQSEAMGQRLKERMANVHVSVKLMDISADRATVVAHIRDDSEVSDETFSLVRAGKGWRVDYLPASDARQEASPRLSTHKQGMQTQEALARLVFEALKENDVDLLLAHRLGGPDVDQLISRFGNTEKARRMSDAEWREFDAQLRQQATGPDQEIRREFRTARARAADEAVEWQAAEYMKCRSTGRASISQRADEMCQQVEIMLRFHSAAYLLEVNGVQLERGWVLTGGLSWVGPVSLSRLNGMSKCIALYYGIHSQPPPDWAALVKEGLLRPDSLVSPGSGKKPPKYEDGKLQGPVDYVYVQLPWRSASKEMIVAYELPENYDGKGTVACQRNLSVRWVQKREFERLLKRTREWLERQEGR